MTIDRTQEADDRAQALVMAEYEEAFERPQYGVHPSRGSGFVRAGGELYDFMHS